MANHLKKHKVPKDSEIIVEGGYFREMSTKDIPQVYKLLKEYLN